MQYDVFLSYKSQDHKIASEVCRYLTDCGLSVFFSQITLGDVGESEYSEIIDKALEKSRHLVVVASDAEYLRHGWVHYEWRTFVNELNCGYKTGNVITILAPEIRLSQLPVGLRHRQSFTTKTYVGNVLNYLGAANHDVAPVSKKKSLPFRSLVYGALAVVFMALVGVFVNYYNQKTYPDTAPSYTLDYSDSAVISKMVSDTVQLKRLNDCFDAAKHGSSSAQFAMGDFCYESGYYEDAVYWFTQSARQENPHAANGIGRCFYHGYGVRTSPRKAFNWFRHSASNGCPEGMNNYAKCLEEGFGNVLPNSRKAMKYYRSAADLANVPAQYNLGVHYLFGDGVKPNKDEGMKWLENAAFLGSPSAYLALGNIYNEGLGGVEANKNVAESWYNKAISSDDEEIAQKAKDKLRSLKLVK